MYHKVSVQQPDYLTVTTEQLRAQLAHLRQQQYEFITVQQWLDAWQGTSSLPPKPVLLTFDDAYQTTLTLAAPILQEFGAKATIFVPTAYVGQHSDWDQEAAAPLLSVEALRGLDPGAFELGLHSHHHQNYKYLPAEEMAADLAACLRFFETHQLPFVRALAYPYGGRPKGTLAREAMRRLFREKGIAAAFRIGNRLNRAVPPDPYELNRIDVRGTDSPAAFARKVRWGKWF